MTIKLNRIFLDTNIFIVGDADKTSVQSFILEALGYRGKPKLILAEIIFSDELIDQIRRVGKYLYGKDKAGEIISNIWRWLNIYYVSVNDVWEREKLALVNSKIIPSEDLEIFLTAKLGKADCFVSGNRELLQAIADFECLTPDNFMQKYIKLNSK